MTQEQIKEIVKSKYPAVSTKWLEKWAEKAVEFSDQTERNILDNFCNDYDGFCLDNLTTVVSDAKRYDIVWYYSYRWNEEDTLENNLHEFEVWHAKQKALFNLPHQTGEMF